MASARLVEICAVLISCSLSSGLQISNTTASSAASEVPWWPFSFGDPAPDTAEAAAVEVEAEKVYGATIDEISSNRQQLQDGFEKVLANKTTHQGEKLGKQVKTTATGATERLKRSNPSASPGSQPRKGAARRVRPSELHTASIKASVAAKLPVSGRGKATKVEQKAHRRAEQKVQAAPKETAASAQPLVSRLRKPAKIPKQAAHKVAKEDQESRNAAKATKEDQPAKGPSRKAAKAAQEGHRRAEQQARAATAEPARSAGPPASGSSKAAKASHEAHGGGEQKVRATSPAPAASATPSLTGPSKAVKIAQQAHRTAQQQARSVAARLEQASVSAQEMEKKARDALEAESSAKKERYAAVKELKQAERLREKESARLDRRAAPQAFKNQQMAIAGRVVQFAQKQLDRNSARVDQLHAASERAKANAAAALEAKTHLQNLSLTVHGREAAAQTTLSKTMKESEQAANAIAELVAKAKQLKAEEGLSAQSYQEAKRQRIIAQRAYVAEDQAAAAKVKQSMRQQRPQ